MGNKITKKLTSVLLSATTVVWLSGSALLPIANAQSSDLQAQINALLAQIAALQAQLAAQQGGAPACNFTRDLTAGVKGDDVKCLQKYLNGAGHKVAASGSGSPGNETTFFGSLTKAAVASWQAANGVSPAAGYFGSKSRAKYSALVAAAPAPAPSGAPAPAGTGLTVTLAPNQPVSGLFGESFASRPFTKLLFSASADGDVTVTSLTVERTGQGNDAAFNGVVALDEDGTRLGDAKTFGSDHKLKLPDKFVVKAGQTRTITLAGDSDSDQNDYNGQLVSLSLVGVEAGSATVNAALPLTGNLMTVNSTLAIGTLTLEVGAFNPNNNPTKEIGTQNYTFTGLKLTAGSNEDVLVKSIRWNQSGSAASGDLANIKTTLDGVTYDTTVSSDGKYYTAKFGDGVKILKGLNKELYIKGDIAGGSNRGIDFDVFRYADIKVAGLTYGYDILPTATDSGASATDDTFSLQNAQPNVDANEVTIGAGTITAQNAPTVGAQNIALNLSDQPLGGYIVDVKGEDITVGSMNFDLSALPTAATGGTLDTDDITNITLSDETGSVVAGPVDGVAGGNNGIRFTNTITFKVGRKVYTLKGKLGTDFSNNDTVAASTTPSADWSTVKGVVSGVTVTPSPTSAVTGSTMTVKAAALTVTIAPDTNAGGSDASSTAQNVVAGTSAYPFTKYVLDASGSGEDIRTTSFSLRIGISAVNTADDITNCQLFDGNTALNSGTNIVNPGNSVASGDTQTFTLDSGLIIPKGTVKTLTMKCNLISGADAGQQWLWGITNAAASIVSTGVTSGTAVTETITADNGRTITARAGGTLAIALDSSTPSARWLQSGITDNSLAVFRLNATDEGVRVDTIGLQLATATDNVGGDYGNASNTPQDLSKVTLWLGATKVGEAVFTANDYATATLTGVTVPKDGQVLLTVKGDTGNIGVGLAARPGHQLVLNYNAQASSDETNTGAVGVGLSSGTTIASGGSDTAANGMRLARSYPTITKMAHPTGKFTNTSSQTLYRFKVSAPTDTNGVSLYKMTFDVATGTTNTIDNGQDTGSTYGVTVFRLYCYSDTSFSVPSCGSFDNSGLLNQGGLANASVDEGGTNPTALSILFNPTDSAGGSTAEAIRVPASETRYFALLADVTGGTSTPTITAKMQGDATFSAGNGEADTEIDGDITADGDNWTTGRYVFATTAANTDAYGEDDFIWSGNSTNTTQSVSDYDWFNGFLVPGLSNADTGVSETLSL